MSAHTSSRTSLNTILVVGMLVLGGTSVLYTTEAATSSNQALAYDANTGDYPWAAAAHIPMPPATDTITWGYQDEATCDNKSVDYHCKGDKVGNYYYRDQWGYDLRNCTSYVAWRLAVEFGVDASNLGNAKTWDDNAPSKNWTVRPSGQAPEVGDIAQWDSGGGGFGHVGFVEAVNSDGSTTVAEFNDDFKGNFGHSYNARADHYIDVNGPNPLGFTLKLSSSSATGTSSSNSYGVKNVAVAPNILGGLSVFTASDAGLMGYKDQTRPGDDLQGKPWGTITEHLMGTPEIVQYPNGALSAFGHGTDARLHHAWQTGPGTAWSGDISPWDVSLRGEPAAVFNYTGGVSVFFPDSNGAMREIDQIDAGTDMGLAPVHTLGGNLQGKPAVMNIDGALALFAHGADGLLYTNYQSAKGGSWSGWQALGGQKILGDPRAIINRLGGMTVLAIGEHGDIVGIDQTHKGESMNKPFYSLAKPAGITFAGTPGVLQTTKGEQMVFATATTGAVYHKAQVDTNSYNWTDFFPLGGNLVGAPTIVRNSAGGASIFGRNPDGTVVTLDQPGYGAAFNSGWVGLGRP